MRKVTPRQRKSVFPRAAPTYQFQKFAVNWWPKLIFQLISEIEESPKRETTPVDDREITFAARDTRVEIKSAFHTTIVWHYFARCFTFSQFAILRQTF